jgi:hypothetical protein
MRIKDEMDMACSTKEFIYGFGWKPEEEDSYEIWT